MKAAVEDSRNDNCENQKYDDCIEYKPRYQQASLPEPETSECKNISGECQRGKNANKNAKFHKLEFLLIGEVRCPLWAKGQYEEGPSDHCVGHIKDGQESYDRHRGPVQLEAFDVLAETCDDTQDFPHGEALLVLARFAACRG